MLSYTGNLLPDIDFSSCDAAHNEIATATFNSIDLFVQIQIRLSYIKT